MGKTKTRGNGEGTIYKKIKNGKTIWCMQYTLGRTNDGKLKRKTIYGKTQSEVKEKYKQLLVELGTDTYVEKNQITVEDIASEIIENGYMLNHLKEVSYLRKKNTLSEIQKHYISKMPIQDVTSKDIMDFYKYITIYSNGVIGKICGLMNSIFRKAIKQNIIKYNFFEDKDEFKFPKSKKPNKKVESFTLSEHKKFLKTLLKEDDWIYKTIFLIELYTGMRMGEILALKLNNINFIDKTIKVEVSLTRDLNDKPKIGSTTKTYSGERIINVDDFVLKIFTDYIKSPNFTINSENLLFYDESKMFFSVSQVNSAFKRFCQKHNIGKGWDVNQHMLRHTFATRCIESGMPANVLAKILGHKNIKTTLQTYCDVFAEYERLHSTNAYNYLKEQNLVLQ